MNNYYQHWTQRYVLVQAPPGWAKPMFASTAPVPDTTTEVGGTPAKLVPSWGTPAVSIWSTACGITGAAALAGALAAELVAVAQTNAATSFGAASVGAASAGAASAGAASAGAASAGAASFGATFAAFALVAAVSAVSPAAGGTTGATALAGAPTAELVADDGVCADTGTT
eukprot:CAMPEP_0181514170 /NCGR_PEP_ID=MMETSP1110-20121109/62889_1 /TAXON_ID=174948 /ORGANISM="Symbiodinium sp., Strain CCMP421" /LENGTH=170 /DNA_ID=CAMNT_0023644085 /DNA_START=79 /DNA_END=589 /DNA_ORIENTATION=+